MFFGRTVEEFRGWANARMIERVLYDERRKDENERAAMVDAMAAAIQSACAASDAFSHYRFDVRELAERNVDWILAQPRAD